MHVVCVEPGTVLWIGGAPVGVGLEKNGRILLVSGAYASVEEVSERLGQLLSSRGPQEKQSGGSDKGGG